MGDSGLDRLAGRLQTNLPRFRSVDRIGDLQQQYHSKLDTPKNRSLVVSVRNSQRFLSALKLNPSAGLLARSFRADSEFQGLS